MLRAVSGLAAIPCLASLGVRLARAQDGPGRTRRLVVYYTGQGHHRDHFLTADGVAGPALDPLAPFLPKLLVVHGLAGRSGHYEGHAECLTGRPNGESFTAAGGPSVDQLLAGRLRGQTALPSLELGCYAGNAADGMLAYSTGGLPIPAAQDPTGVFDRMFRLINEDPAAAARRRALDQSVLDSVTADFAGLSRALAPEARRLLDAHLTVVREQEQALARPVEVHACDLGPSPPRPVELRHDYPTAARLQLGNIAAAMACDVTRVATFLLGYAQNTVVHDWLGHSEDFHQIAHGAVPDAGAKMLAIDRWQASQLAALIGRMDELALLDDSAVVWISELGLHRFDHSKDDAGVVIADAAGGFFRTGRVVDADGASWDDLLVTLAHAAGAPDVERFGATGRSVIARLQ